MKLAIVTPLPPQHTGIADYAADLITGLKNHVFEMDLFSNAKIDSYENIKVFNIEKINPKVLNSYDLIIYQMGNNDLFHLYMVDLMKKYRGIVHLHDMVLHHIFARLTWAEGNKDDYFHAIIKWYGTNVKLRTEHLLNNMILPWETKMVTNIPLFEEYIQYADACIVHSTFVKEKINTIFPELDVYKIDQLYKMNQIKEEKSNNKIIKFGIFGGVDPQKKVDIVLQVFAKIAKKDLKVNFHIVVVGSVHEQCKYILDLPKKYDLENNIKITGRVNKDEFMKYFLDIDVLIALRYPTMGETSAVVMRAMQSGIPCIVNNIGWYSELPDYVKKIPVDNIEEKLEETIVNILNNQNVLKELKKQAFIYNKNNLDFNKYIDDYSKILESSYTHRVNSMIYKQLSIVMDDLDYIKNPVIFTPVINRLIDIFKVKL